MANDERKLFGTDGIRGVANRDPMTAEVALRLGQAVAQRFRHPDRPGRIVIGKDTRLSGYMLESAMQAGIVSAGADVMLVGPLPTPGIAFITWSMRADAGVVISASHNPYQDNGIKIFAADGFKLPDEIEAELERSMERIAAGDATARAEPDAIGKAVRIEDAGGRYVQFLKQVFPKEHTLDGVKVVVDCSNGAAYEVAPQVFQELGAEVIELNVWPDGRNINYECGALHPEKLAEEVRQSGAAIGVALDGDADRLILSDEKGNIVDGDQVMAILATRMLARGQLPQETVVATVMSNLGLERALAAKGGKLLRTAVGDRYVVEAMREKGLSLGGEQSGHIIFLDHATTGDGMVAALRVLAVMVAEGKPLSELAKAMTRYPQVLLNFPVAKKRPFEEMPAVQKVIASVEKRLGSEGRVVVRYSGTESKARVMIEGTDEAGIKAQANEIAQTLQRELAG
ncbi:MAG TPA: phosphoglucosamine mutase [Polyangia bacterium]|nr:phosphoglucosamine mutase [Polyangia bacterium]HVY41022.1 phosphoglucosamine mutase [Polyangia bacterium]